MPESPALPESAPLPLLDADGAAPAELRRIAEERYRTYALSVITSRALPDVRDGLKPVQRRILYSMWEQGLRAGKRFKKCAKVVGDVMGAYHPHGDAAIYDALARMAQGFATRLPLIEGAGNFGSLDGDPPAAMRYTECRLAPAADDVLGEIEFDTAPSRANYDGSRNEPVVLPTRLPLLLVNGSTGIAVGMATSVPPHNLVEIADALVALLDDPAMDIDQLAKIVRGPDFPTGGEIVESAGAPVDVYRTGGGSLRVRGSVEVLGVRRSTRTLHVTSVPYGVSKAQLVQRLGEIVADRSLPALLDVTDLSTDDVQIRLEIRKDADVKKVLAFLYRKTPLQSSVNVDLTCLRGEGVPERVDLRTLLADFLAFRRDVVARRLRHERSRLEKRLHVLEGFRRVFDILDEVLRIIRGSDGRSDAARRIMEAFPLDGEQTDAILELRLYRLARLEIRVVREETKKKKARLAEVRKALRSDAAIARLVRDELIEIRDRYRETSARRTRIVAGDDVEFAEEDFILEEDAVVMLTRDGWVKRAREIRDPARIRLREGDAPLRFGAGGTRASCVLFSSQGSAFSTRIAAVPASTGYGDPVQKLFALRDNERIVGLECLDPRVVGDLAWPGGGGSSLPWHAVAVTARGYALRFPLGGHAEPSKRAGRRFARLGDGDEVLGVALTRGEETLGLVTRASRVLFCDIEEINLLSGAGRGVLAIRLDPDDRVLGFRVLGRKDALVAFTSAGKRSVLKPGERDPSGSRGRRGRRVLKHVGFAGVEHPAPAPPPLPDRPGARSG